MFGWCQTENCVGAYELVAEPADRPPFVAEVHLVVVVVPFRHPDHGRLGVAEQVTDAL